MQWSVAAGLISESEARLLLKLCKKHECVTQEIHQQWHDLRAAFRKALQTIARKSKRSLKKADPQTQLSAIMQEVNAVTIKTTIESDSDFLALPLTRSLLAITNLLSFQSKGKIRQCEGDPCGGYFLDQSRAKPRRWCSMDSCGNRAKVKRFRGQGE